MGSVEIVNTPNNSNDEASALPFTLSFVINTGDKGDELTRRVADILGLPNTYGWSITDTSDHLAMVHYTKGATMQIHGHLRGILVDTEVGAIIADSFGYTPTAVSNKITENNGQITIIDKANNCHIFASNDVVIRRVFEGTLIRIIWHKNRCYKLTHHKINPIQARWAHPNLFFQCMKKPVALPLIDFSIQLNLIATLVMIF